MEKHLRFALQAITETNDTLVYSQPYTSIKQYDPSTATTLYLNDNTTIALKYSTKFNDHQLSITLITNYVFGIVSDKHLLIMFDESITSDTLQNVQQLKPFIDTSIQKLKTIITSRPSLDSEVSKFWISL